MAPRPSTASSLLSAVSRRIRRNRGSHSRTQRRIDALLHEAKRTLTAPEARALPSLLPSPHLPLLATQTGRVLAALAPAASTATPGSNAENVREAAEGDQQHHPPEDALLSVIAALVRPGREDAVAAAALLCYAAACEGGEGVDAAAAERLARVASPAVLAQQPGKGASKMPAWKGRAGWKDFEAWCVDSGLTGVVEEAAMFLREGLRDAVASGVGSEGSAGGAGGRSVERGVVGAGGGGDGSVGGGDGSIGVSAGASAGAPDINDDEFGNSEDEGAVGVDADERARREEAQRYYANIVAPVPQVEPSENLANDESGGAADKRREDHTSHPFEISYSELQFDHKIGEGAFAEVWAGSWLQSPVAVKKFRNPVLLDDHVGSAGSDDDADALSAAYSSRGELFGSAGQDRPCPTPSASWTSAEGEEKLMRYASKILSDDDGSRMSRKATVSALRRFMSDDSREKYAAFLKEVSLMNKLRHPHLLMYMGAVVHPRTPLCIVCELFEGGSLHDYLHTDPSFRPARADALRIALAVARGMNYLHSRSPPFLHRDLKPRNVLLSSASKDPHVAICDFGLCKLFGDDETSTSRLSGGANGSSAGLMGSASYMSPCVINGNGYTCADDVYSFGLLLWEVCTGRIPFDGLRPIQAVFSVSMDGLRPEILDKDELEPELSELITTCWAEDPSVRPSFADVTRRLDVIRNQVLAKMSSETLTTSATDSSS